MADTDPTPVTPTEALTQAQDQAAETQQDLPDAQSQPDEGKGSKEAVLADLARERDKRQKLEKSSAKTSAKLEAVLSALGLNDQQEDPAKAAQQARDAQRAAETKLAVFMHAPAGVDPKALLDSVAVTRGLADIDTSDENAVTDYLARYSDDPRFRTTQPGAGASDAGATNPPATSQSMDAWLRGK